jgi:nickel-dependent lactate racemase
MGEVRLLYGEEVLALALPEQTEVLVAGDVQPLVHRRRAVEEALAQPTGTPPLADLVQRKRPRQVAITVSDITRPVPNAEFLPTMLEVLNRSGVDDSRVVLVVGTGMHRPSTPEERRLMLGAEILSRVEVIDHRADEPEDLVEVSRDPLVRVNRRFVEADFRIVTGYIEPHFMAGFSGGRKGLCPALVDLATIERFHSYETLSHPLAETGALEGNPCHEIALELARLVGVDFLFNVALTRKRQIAGVYCGDLEQAHLAGCRQVARWSAAEVSKDFDLVITSGGGFPLDQTLYQTIKGMVGAMPALGPESTLLQISGCADGLGSEAYSELLLRWGPDWHGFQADRLAHPGVTELDQWELQMQCKVLERVGLERLWLVTDGIPHGVQQRLALTPILEGGTARERAQRAVDHFLAVRPEASVAVVPEGPYTMLVRAG